MNINFTNRCLGCLSNDLETFRSLYDEENARLYSECARLEVSQSPGIPMFLCGCCYGKCIAWKKFQQQCAETYAIFGENNNSKERCPSALPSDGYANHTAEYILDESVLPESCNDKLEPTNREEPHVEEITELLIQTIEDIENQHQAENMECTNSSSQSKEVVHIEQLVRKEWLEVQEISCEICSMNFSSNRALRRHKIKHSDVQRYGCELCDKKFKYATSLSLHRRVHRESRHYVCTECGKSFYRAHTLQVHQLTHTTEKPFTCDVCSKTFKTQVELRNHKVRHDKLKKFLCPDCKKGFVTTAELRLHAKAHSNEKDYLCNHCDKRYKTANALAVHTRLHFGVRPYKCDECPLTFNYSNLLKNHRLVHTGEKPWICDICSKPFRLRQGMQMHRQQHYRTTNSQLEDHKEKAKSLRNTNKQ